MTIIKIPNPKHDAVLSKPNYWTKYPDIKGPANSPQEAAILNKAEATADA